MNKRIIVSIVAGAILGIVCIIGANIRYNGTLEFSYLLSFWFNRVLIGLFIGLLPANLSLPKRLVRGLLAGIFISFAFYSATEFLDLTGFLVGGIYGIIIEYAAYILKSR
jgi:hypothetical protein